MIRVRSANVDDAAAITAIYNQGIAERAATFETTPRRVQDIVQRLAEIQRYPLLVATDETNAVLGWAGLSSYRARECYAGIGEFSVYLAADARGRGIGRQLLQALVEVAREHGYWKLLSRIFLFNTASRALCRAVGFREVGIYEKHGQLEDRWLDVVIVERLIPENIPVTQPVAEAAAAL
ncbi:MAG TPA: arsinothricin resistance N-acetyltransferase ArsN1 family A [Lysobacter sp.]|jgi:phosphinothricin acetyltransferase|nr:arsinothricin resistance N-acetyltransferase ArsN1 family A [Lysobacter sp.]